MGNIRTATNDDTVRATSANLFSQQRLEHTLFAHVDEARGQRCLQIVVTNPQEV
jgi:hypothetical protein